MAMGITNNYSNYATSSTNTTKNVGSTKDSNVNDYSKYLQEKYSYMNTGTTSMQGVPTTVSVSSAFLKKCMNDPEKATYLEENLAAIPNCVKSLCDYVKTAPGSPVVTYATYKIDENGKETGEYTVSATGTDVKAVTQKVIAASLGRSASTGASFDIKA